MDKSENVKDSFIYFNRNKKREIQQSSKVKEVKGNIITDRGDKHLVFPSPVFYNLHHSFLGLWTKMSMFC